MSIRNKFSIFMLIFVIMLNSITIPFAKNADETGEYTDEEWADLENEESFTGDEDVDDSLLENDNWDHKTWYTENWEEEGWEFPEKYVEYAWTVFGATEWTYGAFPNLNFSSFGVGLYTPSNIGEEAQANIEAFLTDYKFTNGTYTIKKKDESGKVIVDNRAYIPLVLACMDVLKGHGTSDDPYAVQAYLTGGKRLSSQYKASNSNLDINVARLVFQRLVAGERAYNSCHKNKINIYQKEQGLYITIQSVVSGSMYAKHKHGGSYCDSYSSSDASSYFSTSRRGNLGYTDFPDFAEVLLSSYECGETEDQYVMDAFGHRVL